MFYSQVILARKGPLGKVWLAAHVLGKLSKDQISKTNIEQSAGMSLRCKLNSYPGDGSPPLF